jgi:tRNA threonylcarbamoyladenosine biosynthesis protein TsaE
VRSDPEPRVDEHVVVPTAGQMRALGRQLAGLLRAGDLVVLSGPLGAGKTTLTQGIGAGLGVRGSVTSPTFVIARLHPSLSAGPDLVHADAYRLGSRAEVDDLDLDADLDSSVTVVEWGEGLVEDLAPSFLSVGIQAADPAAASDAAEASARSDASGLAGAPGAPGGADASGNADASGEASASGASGEISEANEVGDGNADVARTVHVRGWGERWRGAAVVEAARRALDGLRG